MSRGMIRLVAAYIATSISIVPSARALELYFNIATNCLNDSTIISSYPLLAKAFSGSEILLFVGSQLAILGLIIIVAGITVFTIMRKKSGRMAGLGNWVPGCHVPRLSQKSSPSIIVGTALLALFLMCMIYLNYKNNEKKASQPSAEEMAFYSVEPKSELEARFPKELSAEKVDSPDEMALRTVEVESKLKVHSAKELGDGKADPPDEMALRTVEVESKLRAHSAKELSAEKVDSPDEIALRTVEAKSKLKSHSTKALSAEKSDSPKNNNLDSSDGEITGFALINVDTGKLISDYDPLVNHSVIDLAELPSSRINILIKASNIKGIVSRVNGNSPMAILPDGTRKMWYSEANPPFTLAGDFEAKGLVPAGYYAWDIKPGTYLIEVEAQGIGMSKNEAVKKAINLTFIDSSERSIMGKTNRHRFQQGPKIESLTLVNSNTGRPIAGFDPIADGAVIDLAKLPTKRINIHVNAYGKIRQVSIYTNGKIPSFLNADGSKSPKGNLVEKSIPYSLAGDDDETGMPNAWAVEFGDCLIEITASGRYEKDTRSFKLKFIDSDEQLMHLSDKVSTLAKPEITSFTLVNAGTGKPLSGFDPLLDNSVVDLAKLPTSQLTVAANTTNRISSVKWKVNGQPPEYKDKNGEVRARNSMKTGTKPFLITGYRQAKGKSVNEIKTWNVQPGHYQIEASGFDEKEQVTFKSLRILFKDSSQQTISSLDKNSSDGKLGKRSLSPKINSFTLINVDTGRPISGFDPLVDNSDIDLAKLPTTRINIRINTQGDIEWVKAKVNGRPVAGIKADGSKGRRENRIETKPPYSLAGDDIESGKYYAWTVRPGQFNIEAEAYDGERSHTKSISIRFKK
ncbi:MAG: hypothetical protein AAGA18_15420 [Verrucomicrobiota bacterium]